ncbi:hypothetical protein FN846DRAFT_930035 [Sphaerosporella brunnea]|uniref:Myb-like domain-containing protein n=1 Tax=Sphaerosporella brunnea TaxID=1250544 RepID=A0A5J5F9B3_9PEZI|nr:hypothetical protein FN846DRAFT_930035 [Sphaerosporella brunnea]
MSSPAVNITTPPTPAAAATSTTPAATPTPTPTPTPPSVSKGRKGAAAGGGKAWTAAEEVYLLQKRLDRVAYKKIASHLEKTELACRLHYHQLSHGGNRRKRNNSVSSNGSNTSAPSPAASPSAASPSAASPSATKSFATTSFSPVNAAGAIQKPGTPSTAMSKIKGKPLLPKPADGPATGAGAISMPHRQNNAKGKPLRVNCNPDAVDKEKLKRLVKANEHKFWEMIAAQYGEPVDGEQLRNIWQKGMGIEAPPTPAISPSSQASSPTVEICMEEANMHTIATVSEVSTPSSVSLSPTAVAFSVSEVASIREEAMDDLLEEDEELQQVDCKQPSMIGTMVAETVQMAA